MEKDVSIFFEWLTRIEALLGENTDYTYERMFDFLNELKEKNSSEKDELKNAERALSGSLLRTAIKKKDSSYFDLSEKLDEKDHDERCHYGIVTKNVEIIEEELKYGNEEYFIPAIFELIEYYDKEKEINNFARCYGYNGECSLRWIELLNLARVKGHDYKGREVASRISDLVYYSRFNIKNSVFFGRIVDLVDNDFTNAPKTYQEYIQDVERLKPKQEINQVSQEVSKLNSIKENSISEKDLYELNEFNELIAMESFLKENLITDKYFSKEIDSLHHLLKELYERFNFVNPQKINSDKLKNLISCISDFLDGQAANANSKEEFDKIGIIRQFI